MWLCYTAKVQNLNDIHNPIWVTFPMFLLCYTAKVQNLNDIHNNYQEGVAGNDTPSFLVG